MKWKIAVAVMTCALFAQSAIAASSEKIAIYICSNPNHSQCVGESVKECIQKISSYEASCESQRPSYGTHVELSKVLEMEQAYAGCLLVKHLQTKEITREEYMACITAKR